MKKERDLLPWILGGLTLASVAAAITVASTGRPMTPSLPRESAITAQLTAVPVSPPLPPPTAEVLPMATTPLAPEAAAMPEAAAPTEPPVQSGQIWECTTNGLKTFSNNPCGEKSTLLEVRAINTMNPTPEVHYARANGRDPRYAPQYADQSAYGDQNAYAGQDTYADQGNADYSGTSYPDVQGYAFLPRRRPEHPHRPESHHNSGAVARRN